MLNVLARSAEQMQSLLQLAAGNEEDISQLLDGLANHPHVDVTHSDTSSFCVSKEVSTTLERVNNLVSKEAQLTRGFDA